MTDTIAAILELQPLYSPDNTPDMRRRGQLIRRTLSDQIRALSGPLSRALGRFGHDFHVDSSDGMGKKTELPWVRFCSKRMSPRPTEGFYCILHFSTDGSAAHVTLGCSSSQFRNGFFEKLPDEKLDERTAWAQRLIMDATGSLDPFSDPPNFGAHRPLPRAFQRATALCKSIPFADLPTLDLQSLLIRAAELLSMIYQAQLDGREISPADLDEIEIEQHVRRSSRQNTQGIGLSAEDRRSVELRAMGLARAWLSRSGYAVQDTSATHPYDFEARRNSEILWVEVKGTTSDFPEALLMTRNEVHFHQENKGNTALFIVSGIRLVNRGANRRACGGNLEALIGWDIDHWTTTPTAFRVQRSS